LGSHLNSWDSIVLKAKCQPHSISLPSKTYCFGSSLMLQFRTMDLELTLELVIYILEVSLKAEDCSMNPRWERECRLSWTRTAWGRAPVSKYSMDFEMHQKPCALCNTILLAKDLVYLSQENANLFPEMPDFHTSLLQLHFLKVIWQTLDSSSSYLRRIQCFRCGVKREFNVAMFVNIVLNVNISFRKFYYFLIIFQILFFP